MLLIRNRTTLLNWSVWTALSIFSVVTTFPLGHYSSCRGSSLDSFQSSSQQSLARLSKADDADMTEPHESETSLPLFNQDYNDDAYCEVIDEFGALAMERFCELKKNDDDNDQFRWVRIEKQPDHSLEQIKKEEDVMNQIRLAAETQAKYGKSSLFPRRWKHLETGTLNGFAVDGSNDSSFTVMQFNALAEGLSAGPDVTRPFSVNKVYGQLEKNTYGGFTNVEHPDIALDFSLRRWRLLEVILGSNGAAPFDIVAMEEIDRFYGFFNPLMRLFGYQGIFMPKTRSPSVRMGWYSDGCALFWRTDLFEIVSEKRVEYKIGSQVLLLALLKHRATGKLILVTVTHLKAQQSEANEKIRCSQVDELIAHVKEELAVVTKTYKTPFIPVLILGDFNADAPSHTGGTSSAIRNLLNSNLSPNDVPCSVESAYEIDPPEEQFYTTYKTRGTTTTRRIIDYIFYGNLSCQAHLAVPEPDDLGDAKLPSLRYPSDHMAIAAKFDLD